MPIEAGAGCCSTPAHEGRRAVSARRDKGDFRMSVAEARPVSVNAMSDEARETLRMQSVLQLQRQSHLKNGPPSAEKRIEWLDQAIALLVDHQGRHRRSAARRFRPPLCPLDAVHRRVWLHRPAETRQGASPQMDEAREAQGHPRHPRHVRREGLSSNISPRAWSALSARGISRLT